MASLNCYKTLWGYGGSAESAVLIATEQGYDGIEGPVPKTKDRCLAFGQALKNSELSYIAEIATTGTYVPNRQLPMSAHIDYLQLHLEMLAPLQPRFVTCLGGCDAWPLDQSLEFFRVAMDIARQHEIDISFETHRGRSLFNPWVTRDIVAALPDIKLTFDISHWCVVCEGLQATETTLIQQLANNAFHLHARVGYDQGPQVPDPRQGVYQLELQKHLGLWRDIWQNQMDRGFKVITVTPEFGPDGYEYRDLDGNIAKGDLEQINHYMCGVLRNSFDQLQTTPLYQLSGK